MLFVLSGSSGSGKGTIINEVIRVRPEINLMKTCTTRPKRNAADVNYIFLSRQDFEKKIKKEEFFEYEEVHKGNLYGILKESLEKVEKGGLYIKDIDVRGVQKLKQRLKDNIRLIYLDVPKKELRKRIIARGETEKSADLRLSIYDFEKSFMKDYDLVVKNKNLDRSVKIILDYIEKVEKGKC